MSKAGDRVVAISHSDEGGVYIFGYGVYEGDFIPTEAVGVMADAAKEVGLKNPRIRLDNGDVVYGCECWFMSEDDFKAGIAKAGITPILIDINKERKYFSSKEQS